MPDCEQLAESSVIITSYNFNSLLLSNYDTSPGTQVIVSCLSEKTHKLVGSNALTCLPSGQWNDTIPTCVAVKPTPDPAGTVAPGSSTVGPIRSVETCITDYLNLPYLVGLLFLILLCVVLITLLCYSNRVWKKKRRMSWLHSSQEGASTSSPSHQTDLWVEMASPHHFRSHELALSANENNLIKDIRYTQLDPAWSGY